MRWESPCKLDSPAAYGENFPNQYQWVFCHAADFALIYILLTTYHILDKSVPTGNFSQVSWLQLTANKYYSWK